MMLTLKGMLSMVDYLASRISLVDSLVTLPVVHTLHCIVINRDHNSIHHCYYSNTANLFFVELSHKSQTESIPRAKEPMKASKLNFMSDIFSCSC